MGRGNAGLMSRDSVACMQVLVDGLFIELIGWAFFNGDSVHRTGAEAGAQAITKIISGQASFSIDNPQGAFGAVGDAQATAVALGFVNSNDFPQGLGGHAR